MIATVRGSTTVTVTATATLSAEEEGHGVQQLEQRQRQWDAGVQVKELGVEVGVTAVGERLAAEALSK